MVEAYRPEDQPGDFPMTDRREPWWTPKRKAGNPWGYRIELIQFVLCYIALLGLHRGPGSVAGPILHLGLSTW
jgi:hypothetical protein